MGMAGAMIRGLVKSGTVAAPNLTSCDAYQPCLDALKAELGINIAGDNSEFRNCTDVVFIATKPGDVEAACTQLQLVAGADAPIIVSIAAGTTLDSLNRFFDTLPVRIVRA